MKWIFQLYNRIFLDVKLNYIPQSCNLLVIGLYYFNSLSLYFLELLLEYMFYWNYVVHWDLLFNIALENNNKETNKKNPKKSKQPPQKINNPEKPLQNEKTNPIQMKKTSNKKRK